MRRYLVFFILAFTLVACRKSPYAKIDSLFSSMWHENEPGGVVLIMIGDSVVFSKGYGVRCLPVSEDCSGVDVENDENTFFNIASCSKQFTAVAILQLVQQGKISLDDRVNMYFPEYSNPIWKEIKIRHLLSHSSGIPDKRGYLPRERRVNGDEALAVEYFQWIDSLHFNPGTDYEYMNPTYVLSGMLVERIAGIPFEQYVEQNIFIPAGMTKTLYFDRENQQLIPSAAHGYEYGDMQSMQEEHSAQRVGEKNWYEYDFGEETFFATRPDGGIYTSVNELANWERALCRSLQNDSSRIVDGDLLKLAMTPQTKVEGSKWSDYQNREDTWYGYGWFVEPEKGVIYHTGDNGGFKAYIGRYPNDNATVVILSNRTDWDRYKIKSQIESLMQLSCSRH